LAGNRPKKRFSQNFLIDPEIADAIVAALEIRPDDIIFEIGPGRGILTDIIMRTGAQLYAFELDRDLAEALSPRFKNDRVRIIETDFLKVVPEQHCTGNFKLIGNIPYDITSPVLEWMMSYRGKINRAVITAQLELAERIASGPGSHDWAPISIFGQTAFNIKKLMTIKPTAFYPVPNVKSATLLFEPSNKYDIPDWDFFETIVRASFHQRRKMLINNLLHMGKYSRERLESAMVRAGFDQKIRAEQVDIEGFIHLTALLRDEK
jgi:16S rRNA (adenine1518-N6/adenine1519-N6)-dimethyltransferase